VHQLFRRQLLVAVSYVPHLLPRCYNHILEAHIQTDEYANNSSAYIPQAYIPQAYDTQAHHTEADT
jgi:hypothetical protein